MFLDLERKRQEVLIDEIKSSNVKFEIGKLSVGDFAWIARPKATTVSPAACLLLDCVVERKRMDDFCQSIIDGRYKEQKVNASFVGISKLADLLVVK